MIQNGYYFIRWILNSFYGIIESMSSVWDFMTQPIYINTTILGFDINWVSDYVLLDYMFFIGIGSYLTFIVVKFFVDIVL